MKQYLKMKLSEQEWLGSLPYHWDLKRLKFSFGEVNDLRSNSGANDFYVALEHIEKWSGKLNPPEEVAQYESTVKAFDSDDVLFNKLRPYLAKAFVADRKGVCVSELLVLRRKNSNVLPKYLLYFLLSKPTIDLINASTYGAKMPRANWSFIGNLLLPLPPMEEQKAITCYLDEKLEHIQHFIDNKRRLIEMLEEQKRTVAERAVTKGISPELPTKEPGLRWLEPIPEHWQVKRARYFFREVDERSEAGEEELLSVSHKTGVTPRSEKNVTMFKAESYEDSKMCRPNDLVINIMWAWMGAMGVSAHAGIVSSAYGVYRPKSAELFDAEYLDYLVRTSLYIAEYNGRSRGVTSSRARMYTEDFYDIPVVRPPLSEQQEIVAHIKRESAALDEAIEKSRIELSLIEEYRTTLISEIVTGKIDVRGKA